jgi:microcystin-dependent protein
MEPAPPLRELRGAEGGQFTVFRDEGEDARLRLRSVDVADTGRDDWVQFTLRFDPENEATVEHDCYRLYNSDLGEFDLTLSPTATPDPDPNSVEYEATFSRHVPDREPARPDDGLSRRGILASLLGVSLGASLLDDFFGGGGDGGAVGPAAATAGAGGSGTIGEPFLGTIAMFGFDFAPRNWQLCDGQVVAISQYTALFSLLGTQYGGDGQTTLGLPDLQGRVPVHQGSGPGGNYGMGDTGGSASVRLSESEIPSHDHGQSLQVPTSSAEGNRVQPGGNAPAAQPDARGTDPVYTDGSTDGSMPVTGTVEQTGGGTAHENMPPYSTVNYCIATIGIYPQR